MLKKGTRNGPDVIVIGAAPTGVLAALRAADLGVSTIIDGREPARIHGCHIVGERTEEIAQELTIAISAGMRVDDLVHVPLAFPTYTGNIAYAAADAARQLDLDVSWRSNKVAQVRTNTRTAFTSKSAGKGGAHSSSMVSADPGPSTVPSGFASL